MRKIIIMFILLYGTSSLWAQDYKYIEYINEQVMQTEKYQKGNDYQKDFLLLMDLLKMTHPAFTPTIRQPFDAESITNKGYKHLESCINLIDFQFFVSSQLVPLKDGHTFITLFHEDDTKIIFPFRVWLEEDKLYLQVVEKEHETALGKQIISINEFPIVDIFSNFGKVLVAENDYFLRNQVTEWMLSPKIWKYIYKNNNDSLIHLTFYDGTSIDIKAKNRSDIKDVVFVEQKSQNSGITHHKSVPFSFTILEKERLAYLEFNKCEDQNSVRWYYENLGYIDESGNFPPELEEQIQQYPKFDTLLLSMFNEIRLKEISTLIVDVKNNGGGNSELCRQLLSYLIPNIENIKESNSFIRISDFFIKYYPQLYDFLCKIYPKKLETGKLYSNDDFSTEEKTIKDKYFKMNSDSSLVFKGRTIFIQGKKTYSSAGDLLIEARDNKTGMIIGEKSTYKPCNYGDILFWKLPNTETTGGISHKYFTRPDESKCNEDYLAPDVYIPTTFEDYKNGIDPCWEWVKKNYLHKY